MTPDEARKRYEEAMAALPPELQEQFRQILADTRARPTISSLSRAELDALAPEDLETVIAEYIGRVVSRQDNRVAALLNLPRGVQIFYLSLLVEAQVANGGFHQFFWNSSSEFAELIAPALVDLGAPKAATIFSQAFEQAEAELHVQSSARSEGTLEAFAGIYKTSGLSQFDQPFCAESQAFADLRRRIIAENKPTFFAGAGEA